MPENSARSRGRQLVDSVFAAQACCLDLHHGYLVACTDQYIDLYLLVETLGADAHEDPVGPAGESRGHRFLQWSTACRIRGASDRVAGVMGTQVIVECDEGG